MASVSGWAELLFDEVAADLPRDSCEGNGSSSCSTTRSGTGGTSSWLWFFFFRRPRDFRSLENPLGLAFADSGASPACVLGRSDESFEDLSLLLLDVSIASDSAETVQARRDLPPLRLEDSESAIGTRGP